MSYGGRKAWVVRYRVEGQGRLRRLTLGAAAGATSSLSLAHARRKAKAAFREAGLGHDPATAKQERRDAGTFAELAQEYLERHAKKTKRSWKEDQRIITVNLLPAWRDIKVADLKRRDVRALVEGIADCDAPVMANRVLALVSKMLNFALERDWIEANPAAHIRRPTDEQSRERVLTPEELRTLWQVLDAPQRPARTKHGRPTWVIAPPHAAAYKLRLLTAQRGGEILRMRWTDLDLEAGLVDDSRRALQEQAPPSGAVERPGAEDAQGAPRGGAAGCALGVSESRRHGACVAPRPENRGPAARRRGVPLPPA